jgi:threonine synthase
MTQRCIGCDRRYALDQILYTCPACDTVLEIALEPRAMSAEEFEGVGVWRYAPLLPVDAARAVTMGEGDTGLHEIGRLGAQFGIARLHLKNEGENPTGSFKDRGMTVGVTQALQLGVRTVACASTGNTSASLAAYAARGGLRALVLIPGGKIAMGKLSQAIVHGAQIVQVEGNFDDAMRLVRELSLAAGEIYLLNSINPFRLEGQKTLAFEVCEALGRAPDVLILPMGNAGNISAIWKGFCEFQQAGLIDRLPKIIGVQAERAAPLARFLAGELTECRVTDPETIATAIRIGAPLSWQKALAALKDSGGHAATVTDDEILAAQRKLASTEGLFIEPASAVPIAYLMKHRVEAECVVCVATGHGLKDPDAILRATPELKQAEPTLDSLRRVLES